MWSDELDKKILKANIQLNADAIERIVSERWVNDVAGGVSCVYRHGGCYTVAVSGRGDVPARKDCENATFIALAHDALQVMVRRGWHAYYDPAAQGWFLSGHHGNLNAFSQLLGHCFSDPFTALVEADRWYVANIEAHPCHS